MNSMMEKHEALTVLAESPLVGRLGAEWHERLWEAGTVALHKRGSTIILEEEDASHFYLTLDGRVKICRTNPDNGRSVTLFLLAEGDGFDLINLLDSKLHTIAAEAIETACLLAIPKPIVRSWMAGEPDFIRAIFPALGQRMNQLVDTAADYALFDTASRLARLIVRHVRRDNGRWQLEHIGDLPHHELAEMMGTVRAVINRQIQHLKANGILDVQRNSLRVKDLERLEGLCRTEVDSVSRKA